MTIVVYLHSTTDIVLKIGTSLLAFLLIDQTLSSVSSVDNVGIANNRELFCGCFFFSISENIIHLFADMISPKIIANSC